jgi:cob(I)alamin adenosyltransferase
MSIITKQGDHGETALMYNRRVSKCHPRVEAYGAVDELTAALGLARANLQAPAIQEEILTIQRDLIHVMGELATAVEDLPRYVADGFVTVNAQMTHRIEQQAKALESQQPPFRGWALPGGSPGSAALDLARAICRRAERRVCNLHDSGQLQNAEIIVFLNRLSDLLWLLARSLDHLGNPANQP